MAHVHTTVTPVRSSAGPWLMAVVLCGLLLRVQIAGVGPLIPAIRDDLGGSWFLLGLLTTVPVLTMALSALFARRWGGVAGAVHGITGALALLAIAGFVRAGGPNVPTMVLATVPMGIGIGMAGALVPMVIKTAPGLSSTGASGAHVAGVIAGSGLATAISVPLADLGGTWRLPFVVLALASLLGTLAWIVLLRGARSPQPTGPDVIRTDWRAPGIWLIVALFVTQASIFWGMTSWIAAAYQQRGWTAIEAAQLTTVLNTSPLLGAVWISWQGERFGSRRPHLLLASGLVTTGMVMVAGMPVVAPIGAALVGAGLGALFALVIVLPLDVARSPAQAASLTAVTFSLGFGAAALAPVIMGYLADRTGSFELPLWTMTALAGAMLLLSTSTAYARVGQRPPPRR